MLPMQQSNTHQMELPTILLSILQRHSTWPFATKLPQKQTGTLWWRTLGTLQYWRRRRWESEQRMLKTPGKRCVSISPNKNKIFFLWPISFYIIFPSIYSSIFTFEPFFHWYEHSSFTFPCPFSHFYQFDFPEGQFHIYLIPLLFSLNITPGIPTMPTSSSASAEYCLDYIMPTFYNPITSNPSWMSLNPNDQFLKDLKHYILYPSII